MCPDARDDALARSKKLLNDAVVVRVFTLAVDLGIPKNDEAEQLLDEIVAYLIEGIDNTFNEIETKLKKEFKDA